jgi:23S rRNA pseudouridine1911/1915/1917 synthase
VHLAWLKHPVVGDEVYGAGRDKTVAQPAIRSAIGKLNRQFLHAGRLAFQHPRTDERLVFTAKLPSELQNLLNLIREDAGLSPREY